MSTATTTKAEELRDAERRLGEIEAGLRVAETGLQEARGALADGSGSVQAVSEADGRVNALRGAAEDLQGTVSTLRAQCAADSESERVRESVEEYRAQSRECAAAVERYLMVIERLRLEGLAVVEEGRKLEALDLELRQLGIQPPAPTPAQSPEMAWDSTPGAKLFHKETWNRVRQIIPADG